MELILLRHAKTAGNLVKRYVGCRTDEPLVPEGIAQASAFTEPDVERVYVSPLKRAVETAKLRYPNAALFIVHDFREMDFGDFEGLSPDEMSGNAAYRAWVDANCEPTPPGAPENMREYSERVCAAFIKLIREARERGEVRIVTVSHGGTIMAAMTRWAKPEREYYLWTPSHCSGYIAELDGDWDGSTPFAEWRKL